MAIRNILRFGDKTLNKNCREVDKINERIITLLEDMAETMHNSNGVGLAAPQVGVLKRIAVIDVGEGVIELINPKIISTSGEVNDLEGCLSLPGKYGYVVRPQTVTVGATDRHGKYFELTGSNLLARAFCHELEHLNGVLFTTHVTEFVDPDKDNG